MRERGTIRRMDPTTTDVDVDVDVDVEEQHREGTRLEGWEATTGIHAAKRRIAWTRNQPGFVTENGETRTQTRNLADPEGFEVAKQPVKRMKKLARWLTAKHFLAC